MTYDSSLTLTRVFNRGVINDSSLATVSTSDRSTNVSFQDVNGDLRQIYCSGSVLP